MKHYRLQYILFIAAMNLAATLYSVPVKYNYGQESSTAIREMRASIEEMRHEMNNHEAEIRTFEEKLANQELIIESLREQNANANKLQQDLAKTNLSTIDMKLGSLDTTSKGLISDLKHLKSYANNSGTSIASCQQKIINMEKIVETQNANIENLQAALKLLMNILEVKHELSNSDEKGKTYCVQAGDSLEKIARIHKTTIKIIKDLNDLNSDRINVGQNIKVP